MANEISPAVADSPFGKLSIELRLEIYKRVLDFDSLHYVPHDGIPLLYTHDYVERGTWWATDQDQSFRLKPRLALTLVCKQIRIDSAGLVLEINASRLNLATVEPTFLRCCEFGETDDQNDSYSLYADFHFRDACPDVLIALLSIPSLFNPRSAEFCLHFTLHSFEAMLANMSTHKDPLVRSTLESVLSKFKQCNFTFAFRIDECNQLQRCNSDPLPPPVFYLQSNDHAAGLESISRAFARRKEEFPDHHRGHQCDFDERDNERPLVVLEFMARQFNNLLAELKPKRGEKSVKQSKRPGWQIKESNKVRLGSNIPMQSCCRSRTCIITKEIDHHFESISEKSCGGDWVIPNANAMIISSMPKGEPEFVSVPDQYLRKQSWDMQLQSPNIEMSLDATRGTFYGTSANF